MLPAGIGEGAGDPLVEGILLHRGEPGAGGQLLQPRHQGCPCIMVVAVVVGMEVHIGGAVAGVVPVPAPAQVGTVAGQLPAIIGLLKAHLAVAPHLEEQSAPFGVVVRRVIIGGQHAGTALRHIPRPGYHNLVRQLRRQGGQPTLQGNLLLRLNS